MRGWAGYQFYMEALKATLDCLRNKKNIAGGAAEQLFPQARARATFQALAAIFVFTTPASDIHDNSAKDIIALEKLAALVGPLTDFPLPCSHLARFHKQQFYNYCREHQKYEVLVNKVYGLFPTTNIRGHLPLLMEFDADLCKGEEVGNPYWLLTRSISNQWLEASREDLAVEIAFSCDILLANHRMLDVCDCSSFWSVWDCVWVILYLWLTRKFLQPHLEKAEEGTKPSWCVLSDQEFRQRLVALEEKANNPQDKTLFSLVRFTVEEYILGQRQNEHFKSAVESFAQVPCSSWQHLLTLQIMKQISSILKHDRLAVNCESMINESIEKVNPCPQFEYLLPHLLPENQVRSYILKRRLEFWNYGLDRSVVEDIASVYLAELPSFTEEQRPFILANLSKASFLSEVLRYSEMESNKKLGKAIVRTVHKARDQLASKFHTLLSLSVRQCKNGLQLFAKQWEIYFDIHIGINDENADSCFQFLTFQRRQLSESFGQRARFPQSSPAIYYQVLQKLTEYLLSDQHPIFSLTDLLFNPSFVDYFQSLSEPSRDELWAKWSDLLLEDEEILCQLMEVPVSVGNRDE